MASVRPGATPSPDDLRDAKRLAALAQTVLPRTRAVAEKWRNGLAGLLGLVAAASVVKGRESLDDLAAGAKLAVGILMGVAVLVGLASLSLAMVASFGWPSKQRIRTIGDLADWESDEAERVVLYLRLSMVGTVLFVLLLVATLGVAWFGPGTDLNVRATRDDGQVICGSDPTVEGNELSVSSNGAQVSVPLERLTGLAATDDCSS